MGVCLKLLIPETKGQWFCQTALELGKDYELHDLINSASPSPVPPGQFPWSQAVGGDFKEDPYGGKPTWLSAFVLMKAMMVVAEKRGKCGWALRGALGFLRELDVDHPVLLYWH